MPANPPAKNPPEERLVNLVVALMATEQGLTKDTILTSVAGYREQSEAGATKDALEKMFERDKESLRGLGVPIETIGDWADPDDLREARYRVPTAEYALPEDIEFTPAELALLNLAGGVWSESSMSDDARSGLRKIRALGIAVDEPIIGYSPRISLRDPSFPALQQAIEQCRVVTFPYLKPGEDAPRIAPGAAARARRVRGALARLRHRSRRRAPIAPSCSRASSAPSRSPAQAFDPALREGAGERALAGLEAGRRPQLALLEVNPGTEAALRLSRRATPAEQGIRVPFVDVHVFADELASYGPEVRVVEPAALRDAGHRASRARPATCTTAVRHEPRASPLVATDRAALMLQLVPYLIGKGEVSLAEAAAEFDVTPDQMRTMVEKLTVIGLPGDGGYWQMPNELFDIDWDLLDERDTIAITNSVGLERSPKLTAREAAALLAGLQLAQTIPGRRRHRALRGPPRQALARRLEHSRRGDRRSRTGRRGARPSSPTALQRRVGGVVHLQGPGCARPRPAPSTR